MIGFIIIAGVMLAVIVAVAMLIKDWYENVWQKRTRFYDNKRCRHIISKYCGDYRDERILRALVAGDLQPRDIRRYYNYGKAGFPIDQEYRLINQLDQDLYDITRYKSGSNHSMLFKVEVDIKDGNGRIIQHWICA